MQKAEFEEIDDMKIQLTIIATAACALLQANPLFAGKVPAVKKNGNTTNDEAISSASHPETLSGKISMVDPLTSLVVIQTPDGVHYDLDVTSSTRIRSGDRSISLQDLTRYRYKPVSVDFVPERHGDVARSIRIGG